MTSNELVVLPRRAKWQRASRPKVRTGCLTCKVRHLKCDEEKPTCRRCRDGRVKCDGYAVPSKKQLQERAFLQLPVKVHSILSLNPRVADSSIESCYFHHFHHWTSSQLTCAPGSSNFYLNYVLPLAHTCEPIKHAIIAVGAAHRFFMAGQETCSPLQQLRSLAMQQYNKAISHIIPHMCLDSAFDIQCTLVCCLLFVAFEGINGRYAETIRHIRAGVRLLSSPALIDAAQGGKSVMKLAEMFSNLGVEASLFLEDSIIPDNRTGSIDALYGTDISDQPFRDLDEAASSLRKLDVKAVDIMGQEPCPDGSSPGNPFNREYMEPWEKEIFDRMWDDLVARFEEWNSRFELTKKHIAMWEYQDLQSPQLTYLVLQQRFWRMCMTWENEEFAEPVPEAVDAFLDAAEAFAQTVLIPGQASFSLDGDLVSSLSMVVWSCSDPLVRDRALDLLRRLNRREGIWDSREIVELHEATLALEDPRSWYRKDIPGGVPGYVAELAKISSRASFYRSGLLASDFLTILS